MTHYRIYLAFSHRISQTQIVTRIRTYTRSGTRYTPWPAYDRATRPVMAADNATKWPSIPAAKTS